MSDFIRDLVDGLSDGEQRVAAAARRLSDAIDHAASSDGDAPLFGAALLWNLLNLACWAWRVGDGRDEPVPAGFVVQVDRAGATWTTRVVEVGVVGDERAVQLLCRANRFATPDYYRDVVTKKICVDDVMRSLATSFAGIMRRAVDSDGRVRAHEVERARLLADAFDAHCVGVVWLPVGELR